MRGGAEPLCPICGVASFRSAQAVIAPFVRERCDLPASVEAKSHLCDSCDHAFLTPFLTEDELQRLYEGYRGEAYNRHRQRLEPSYAATAAALSDTESIYFRNRRAFYDAFHAERFSLRGIVVDAGDGEGYFGRYAYPHADVVSLPRFGEPPGVVLPDLLGAADVLMVTHTLQQSPRPAQALGRLTQRLRAGADVWIEVPVQYFGSLRASFESQKAIADRGVRPFGPLATLHETLCHYSVTSLRRLCRLTGLVPVEFVRSEGVLGVLAQRAIDRVQLPSSSAAIKRTPHD